MENKELAREIFRIVGPGENVRQASHCMTRLRLQLDRQDVDRDALKKLPGVMGVNQDMIRMFAASRAFDMLRRYLEDTSE